MQEEFIHFAYMYKLYHNALFFNVNSPELLENGKQNFDSGPDFIGAKFKTAEALWVGNVELHIKSSDWNLHKHNLDKAYNNVILHVVINHDCDVYTESGRLLPVMQINISNTVTNKYNDFIKTKNKIACASDIAKVDDFKLKMWLSNVLIKRISSKIEYINNLLEHNTNNWEHVFYQFLARSFGFKVNAEPFEKLAKSIPLIVIAKHRHNHLQIEALFMGQAGLLNEEYKQDSYYNKLKEEYAFLRNKFNLQPIEKHEWKFMRLRPSNFPTIRIAQFVNLMYKHDSLFSKILETDNIKDLKKIFEINASKYWDTHYTFAKESKKKIKILGAQSVDLLLINSIIPSIFAYGYNTDNEQIKNKALDFLEQLNPEKNKIIKYWENIGIKVTSSFYTQALLEQKKSYCDNNKCLQCGIGVEILKSYE